MNVPILLTDYEKKKPKQVIHQFCKTFGRSYVQIELRDMLDAVITYKVNFVYVGLDLQISTEEVLSLLI